MKRTVLILLAALTVLTLLSGCAPVGESAGISVVCTTFAPYDFLCEITEGAPDVKVRLLAEGSDPHSFQPTAEHFAAIYSADLFVYIGEASEPWAADAAALAKEQGVRTLSLWEGVGMSHDGEHEGHDHTSDEHIWLSLSHARSMCALLGEAMCLLDPDRKELYLENLSEYDSALATLDTEYRQMIEGAEYDTVIVADRYPFTYMMEEYDITAHAAFPGCEAESEAGFEQVAALAGYLRELGLPAVLITETSDGALAKTVCHSAGVDVPVLTLHSLQAVSASRRESGAGYITLMKENLEVLGKALNK